MWVGVGVEVGVGVHVVEVVVEWVARSGVVVEEGGYG